MVFAPTVAYKAMELHKGVGNNGGVIDFPLAQMTMQLFVHMDRLPPGFARQSREYGYTQLHKAFDLIDSSAQDIPENLWMRVPDEKRLEYMEMFRRARIELRDQGVYDGRMLRLLRKVRCKMDKTQAECTATDKE